MSIDSNVKQHIASCFSARVWVIWGLVVLLMILSILEIYSISGATVRGSDADVHFVSRIRNVLIAIFVIFIVQISPIYKWFRNINFIRSCYILTLALQLSLPLFGTDDSVGGESKRSIFGIQPTEFAIIITMVYSVFLLLKNQKIIKEINYFPVKDMYSWLRLRYKVKVQHREIDENDEVYILRRKRTVYIYKKYSLPMIAPMFILFAAIILGGNLSTAFMLALIWVVTAFVAGLPFVRHVKVAAAFGVLFVCLIFMLEGVGRTGTWTSRIDGYFENISGEVPNLESSNVKLTQVNMAEIAIALGRDPAIANGGSMQRSLLQQSFTDYIYAILTERYGLIGAILVMMLYTIIYYRFRAIGQGLKSNYDAMIVYSLGFIILFQMIVHVYVSVGLAPSTGLTLPFISKGGSSLIAMSLVVGIILSYERAEKMALDQVVESDKFIDDRVAHDEKVEQQELDREMEIVADVIEQDNVNDKPIQEEINEPAQEFVQEPFQEEINEPAQELVQEPIQESVSDSTKESVQDLVQESDELLEGNLGQDENKEHEKI